MKGYRDYSKMKRFDDTRRGDIKTMDTSFTLIRLSAKPIYC